MVQCQFGVVQGRVLFQWSLLGQSDFAFVNDNLIVNYNLHYTAEDKPAAQAANTSQGSITENIYAVMTFGATSKKAL